MSESSRGLLRGSSGPLRESLLSGGPWLVPRSKNFRFKPLSPLSTSVLGTARSVLFVVAVAEVIYIEYGFRVAKNTRTCMVLTCVVRLVHRRVKNSCILLLVPFGEWGIGRIYVNISLRRDGLHVPPANVLNTLADLPHSHLHFMWRGGTDRW